MSTETIKIKKTENITLEKIKTRLKAGLIRHKVAELKEAPNKYSFTGGMFRPVTNWNLFYGVSKGEIILIESENQIVLTYTMSFKGAFITFGILIGLALNFCLYQLIFNNSENLKLGIVFLALFSGIGVLDHMIKGSRLYDFFKEVCSI